MPSRLGLPQVVERLRNGNGVEREAAANELSAMSRLGLSTGEALRALQSAAGEFPPRTDGKDTGAQLVRAAARMPRRVYLPVIEEHFAHYSERAKVEALRLLLCIGDRKAADLYMSLVRRHSPRGEIPCLASEALLDNPRQLERLFPGLLELIEQPCLAAEVCELTIALCEEGQLEPESLRQQAGTVLRAYRTRRERLLRTERLDPSDLGRQAELLAMRDEALLMLELLGYLATPEAEAELQSALFYRDARLKSVAIGALLRLGKHVDPSHLSGVAEDPEARSFLAGRLRQLGKSALLKEAGERHL
jgi:hypothetical protein